MRFIMVEDWDLTGIRVLVTRPEPQASRLCQSIQERGGVAYNCPMIDITPLQPALPLAEWRRYDWLIFVSANAVRFALDVGMRPMADVRIAAIGPATAKVLEKAGFPVTCQAPAPYTSESLLTVPALREVAGQKLLIVKGQGGRELLQETLRDRGAEVSVAEVYRRTCPRQQAVERLHQVLSENITVVTATSGEILANLIKAANGMTGRLLQLPIVVVSERLADLARIKGFTHIIIAASASDMAILKAIEQWRVAAAES